MMTFRKWFSLLLYCPSKTGRKKQNNKLESEVINMFNKQPKLRVEGRTISKVEVATDLVLLRKIMLSLVLTQYQYGNADLYLRTRGSYNDNAVVLTFKDLLAVGKFVEALSGMVKAAQEAAKTEFAE
jgi:hypothetical protein